MTTSHTASDGPAISQPKMFKHGVILCLFCLGFGLLLAITDEITLADIAARDAAAFTALVDKAKAALA